jgi:hypothetical protein
MVGTATKGWTGSQWKEEVSRHKLLKAAEAGGGEKETRLE